MLSARSLFDEIRSNDDSYALFLSIASKGEHQGGWENQRIAKLTADPVLAAKIARHGEDEAKHGRLFATLLRKRGLGAVEVPLDTDYCLLLERAGIGLSHERLRRDEPLSDREVLAYLAHSRVTEQRAKEEVELQRKVFADDPEIGKAVRLIAEDEENHLAYCHEELLRLGREGHRETIDRMLRECARAEIRTYRDVSLAVMRRVGEMLAWPRWKRSLLALGIRAVYLWERAFGWRRMVSLAPPARANPMAPRTPDEVTAA